MKWINFFIGFLIVLFVSIWTFNHIHAWIGIGIAFALFYVVLYKIVNYIKELDNV